MGINWAIGEDSDKAEQPELLGPSREIVWLSIEEMYNHTGDRWTIDLENPTRKSLWKAEDVQRHIESGGWVDPSDVQHVEEGCIKVEGRHRLLVAHWMGHTHAPFSVKVEDAEKLKALVG